MTRHVRCKFYDDNGTPIGRGCFNPLHCEYVHPSESQWDRAERRAIAGRGPRPGNAPKGPRALTNFGRSDTDPWSTGDSSGDRSFQKSSANAWNSSSSSSKPSGSEAWAKPATPQWNTTTTDSNWATGPSPWAVENEQSTSSLWGNTSSAWGSNNATEGSTWGSGQSSSSKDQPGGDTQDTAAQTSDHQPTGKDSIQSGQPSTDVDMKDAEPSASGWNISASGWNSSATMPPPPPPTTVPPTPPVSSGFEEPLRINPPGRKSSQSEPGGWNVLTGKPPPAASTSNPLKRKYDEPPTPTSPSVSIGTSNSNFPRPRSEAAINAMKQRLKAEDEASAESRSSSVGLSRDSSSEGGEAKKRKETKPVSKMKRGDIIKVWHNHIKCFQRALNARRKQEEAETNLAQCEAMVQSDRFKFVGSSAQDALDGHHSSYLLEAKHHKKRYEDVLTELVKNDEQFDIHPQTLFRTGEDTERKKDMAEIKRYLESARNWMETTQGEIEAMREARERAERDIAAAATPSTIPSTDPGPSEQKNDSVVEKPPGHRKTSAKVLKRLDELEEHLAHIDTDFDSLMSSIEEKVKDQVEGTLEDFELPGHSSDDEMDDDSDVGKGMSDAPELDGLVQETRVLREEIQGLKDYADATKQSAIASDGGVHECRAVAEQLRAKETRVRDYDRFKMRDTGVLLQISDDVAEARATKEELSRVLDEARKGKADLEAAYKISVQQYTEATLERSMPPLVETLLVPLLASIKQSVLPEVEEIGQAVKKEVEKSIEALNAKVIETVWEKVEKPLEAAMRMANNLNLKGPRSRTTSLNQANRQLPSVPFLVPSGSQPSNSNVVQ
ncbi:hypothetical protein SCHPADRAFT_6311 [Schizopora paradoxa]|uniref:C3H1-type domain-containing protein n=1 Tax=Schizopora paradoxa TaxID=27342 RepID=A0A0H2SF98_9AGAM|nr:hypothetical protein SCHPADRAFT_6311 [Schizopora paradoxa]